MNRKFLCESEQLYISICMIISVQFEYLSHLYGCGFDTMVHKIIKINDKNRKSQTEQRKIK